MPTPLCRLLRGAGSRTFPAVLTGVAVAGVLAALLGSLSAQAQGSYAPQPGEDGSGSNPQADAS